MNHMQSFAKLNEIFSEIVNLNRASSVLYWDQNTYMPACGANARGLQIATLGKLAHEKKISTEVGKLLDSLQGFEEKFPYSSYEASFVRYVKREYVKANKVPASFISEALAHQSLSYEAWLKAKRENNFKIVQPYLEKNLDLSKKYADYFQYDHIADPLIADYDYGFTTKQVKQVFNTLQKELVPFVKEVLNKPTADDAFLKQYFPISIQEKFSKFIIEKLGFDFSRGRIDSTYHPFMISFAHGDIRILTRYHEHFHTESIFSSIHEVGHALYELGNDIALDGTPLFGGTSSGVHESQSRLWENIVARSFNFWYYFYPKLQSFFPEQLNKINLKEFYFAINKVTNSLIRTDADELTYNLHVLIRFNLELEMLEGKLKIKDLPDAWNAYYLKDLGVIASHDGEGCLQDSHWYDGFIGGQFQGYTLGNIMSAQLYSSAEEVITNLDDEIKEGNFASLKNWLGENLHKHGKKYTGLEVLKMATKKDLTIEPYMTYLRKKFPIK